MEVARVEAAVGLTGVDQLKSGLASGGSVIDNFAKSITSMAGAPVSALGKLTSGLGSLGLASMGLTAIGGAATGAANALGFGLVNEMEQVTASFNAFTKDSGMTADMLKQVRDEANKTPFAFAEMAKATASLLPVAKSSGASLVDLQKQAEILAASNPMQGLEGASFSLREAMTGDFTSIIERFNLSRSTLNKLKEQGVPALEAVKIAMGEMGFDADLIAAKAETLDGRWSTFMDTIDTVKMTMAQPLFDAAKQGLMELSSGIEGAMPAIQGFAADFAGGFKAALDGAMGLARTWGPRFMSLLMGGLSVGKGFAEIVTGGENSDALQTGLEQMFGADSPAIGTVMDFVMTVGTTLRELSTVVSDAVSTVGQVMAGDWAPGFDAAGNSINPVVEAVGNFAVFVRDVAVPAAQQLGQFLMDPLGTSMRAIAAIVGPVLGPAMAELGSTALPAVTAAAGATVDVLTGFVSAIRENVALGATFAAVLGTITAAWALHTAGTLAAAVASKAVALATGIQTAAQWALNAAMTANPIGVVVMALAGLAAGLVYAYQNSEQFRAAVDGLAAGAVAAFGQVIAFAQDIPGAISAAGEGIGGFFASIGEGIGGAVDGAMAIVEGFVSGIGDAFNGAGDAIGGAMESVGAAVTGGWESATAAGLGLVQAFQEGVKAIWNLIPADIQADLVLIGSTLIARFAQFVTDAVAWGQNMATTIGTAWTTITTAFTTGLTVIGTAITTQFLAFMTPITTWVATTTATVTAAWTTFTGLVTTGGAAVLAAITGAFTSMVTAATTWVTDMVGQFTTWATGIGTQATTAATNLTTPITSAFAEIVGGIGRWVGEVLGAIGGLASSIMTEAGNIGRNLIQGILNALVGGAGRVADEAWNVARGMLDSAKRALDIRSPSREGWMLGDNFINAIADGIGNNTEAVRDAIRAVIQTALDNDIQPLIALALAKAESGLKPRALGDSGNSGGLFQLHSAGQGAGMTNEQKFDPWANSKRFLEGNAQLFQELLTQGFQGVDLANVFGRKAERPAGMDDPNGTAAQGYMAAFNWINQIAQLQDQTAIPANQRYVASIQQVDVWAKTMADQQAALAQVMSGQVDRNLISTTAAMTNFGAVLGPIERQVAGGAISMDTLQFKLVDLARATGLATTPWDQYSAGVLDIDQALKAVINQSSDAGLQFDTLRQKTENGVGVTDQLALEFLQLALNYQTAKDAMVPAVDTTNLAAKATGAASTNTASLTEDFRALGPAIEEAREQLRGYTNYLFELEPGRLKEQMDGWNGVRGSINEAASALRSYVDILNEAQSLGADLPGRASGGPVTRGRAYRVGENGEETFVAPTNGYIIPRAMGAGEPGGAGGPTVIQVNGDIILQGVQSPQDLARALQGQFATIASDNGELRLQR